MSPPGDMAPGDSAPGGNWQILALRYAENTARTRRDSFIMATDPDAPHPMDFYFWVLRRNDAVIVVDTGMDDAEGRRRGRPILREPADMLAGIGIDPAGVETLVITHLHFDHAGCLEAFPNAVVHVQAAELAFATGPMMANPTLGMPYTTAHITRMVELVHEGRAIVHQGTAPIAAGATGHLIGGHADGLMALTVETSRGALVLASDVAHYYESVLRRPIFHIVSQPKRMVSGYQWAWQQADGDLGRILPAHDPLIRRIYPEIAPDVFDLSAAPGPVLASLMETIDAE